MEQVSSQQHHVRIVCCCNLENLLKGHEGIVLADLIFLPHTLHAGEQPYGSHRTRCAQARKGGRLSCCSARRRLMETWTLRATMHLPAEGLPTEAAMRLRSCRHLPLPPPLPPAPRKAGWAGAYQVVVRRDKDPQHVVAANSRQQWRQNRGAKHPSGDHMTWDRTPGRHRDRQAALEGCDGLTGLEPETSEPEQNTPSRSSGVRPDADVK